jgi:predicted esterase
MDFSAVTDEVYRLYREGKYQEGADLVARERQYLPERDSRLTFWEGCFQSMAGNPQTAVEILRAGTARGLWWPEGMLADRDLDAARVVDGWSEVVAASEAHERARMDARPPMRVRSGRGGTVLALHGAHADPVEFADRWEAGVPGEWGVVTPVGSLPLPEGGWSWSHDTSPRVDDVIQQLSGIEIVRPMIVAGFSAGATLGIELVAGGFVQADCLVLMSPYVPDSDDTVAVLDSLCCPVVLVYGSEEQESETYDSLSASVSKVVVVQGIGHRLPEDLSETFDVGRRLAAPYLSSASTGPGLSLPPESLPPSEAK